MNTRPSSEKVRPAGAPGKSLSKPGAAASLASPRGNVVSAGKSRALRSSSEVVIGGVYETQIGGAWCPVRVVAEASKSGAFRRFFVVREPHTGNSLNPRSWLALRCQAPKAEAAQ